MLGLRSPRLLSYYSIIYSIQATCFSSVANNNVKAKLIEMMSMKKQRFNQYHTFEMKKICLNHPYSRFGKYIYSRKLSTDELNNINPYEVLGVPEDASMETIKKKYRELVKLHHPDVNKNSSSNEKMALITNAYQILSNPEKKRAYDEYKSNSDDDFQNIIFNNINSMWGRNFSESGEEFFSFKRPLHVWENITITLLESIKGITKTIQFEGNEKCSTCHGKKCEPGTNPSMCKVCLGKGVIRIERGTTSFSTTCYNCHGLGTVIEKRCLPCKGTGIQKQSKNVTVDIPQGIQNEIYISVPSLMTPGIRDGMRLNIVGQGHYCAFRSIYGNLYVNINVKENSLYTIDNDNIHSTAYVTLDKVFNGGEVTIPLVDGDINILVKPYIIPGDHFTISNKGLKKLNSSGFGDAIIHWKLKLPEKLTHEQREAIKLFNVDESSENASNTNS